MRALHVCVDFRKRTLLCARQRKGQGTFNLAPQVSVSGNGSARQAAHAQTHEPESKLVCQQLVVSQSRAGGSVGVEIGGGLRFMRGNE